MRVPVSSSPCFMISDVDGNKNSIEGQLIGLEISDQSKQAALKYHQAARQSYRRTSMILHSKAFRKQSVGSGRETV